MSSLYDWGEYISIFNPLSWKYTETSHLNSLSSGGMYPTDSAPSWVESIRSGEAFLFYFFMDEFRNFQSFAVHIFKYVKCYHKAWKPQSSLSKWILQLQSPDLLGFFWGAGGACSSYSSTHQVYFQTCWVSNPNCEFVFFIFWHLAFWNIKLEVPEVSQRISV